jgi:hypothetical protein
MLAGKLMKSGGLATLAAGLALMALPAGAQAQDRGHGRWSGGQATQSGADTGSWRGRGNGGWQGNGGGHGYRSEQSAPTPAPAPQVQAQPQRNWSRGDGERGNGGSRWNGSGWRGQAQAQTAPTPQVQTGRRSWQGNGGNAGGQWQGRNRSYVDPNRDATYGARARNDTWRSNDGNRWRGNDGNGWRNDRRGYAGNWNRGWRNDNRYNWRGYRDSHRDLYRLRPYYAPYRGYSYRQLGIGFYLDPLFYGSDYLIDDPWYYRLPPADGPYRWVRYYDDALLVDIYTGEVVDVIRDFFW